MSEKPPEPRFLGAPPATPAPAAPAAPKFAAYLEKNARKSAAAADEYRRFRTPFE